jgi:hypothetical protein
MKDYLKVDSDHNLVRDLNSNAIINNSKSEFENFLKLSEIKRKEKQEFENLKNDVNDMKSDLEEIKNLLKSIVSK